MWYVYRQNNSGGYYRGPEVVAVKARDVQHANLLALDAGVDPDAPYCDCCGLRWTLLGDDPCPGYEVYETLDEVLGDTPDGTVIVKGTS